MEWNVHESFQGSAGLWDSHFHVGGAAGSNLQAADCPKQSSPLKESCNQLDIFAGRGILIESQGPTWLYGTSFEHNVLYQYQLSGARNVVMGMIQTESPYFQPIPAAPKPFGMSIGGFANDPDMTICKTTDKTCGSSWGVRIVDSESIYLLGAGMYSLFSSYSQDCVDTNDCQQRAFEVEQSSNIWIVNLVTKAILESISSFGEIAIWARDTRNGFTSSLLGWFREGEMIGKRNFIGFALYGDEIDAAYLSKFSTSCRTSMTQSIDCHDETYLLQGQIWRGGLDNDTLSDLICDHVCEASSSSWFGGFVRNCNMEKERELIPTRLGGQLWAGWNETCLKDPETDRYCGDIIDDFTVSTPYSIYDKSYQSDLKYINEACGLSIPTAIQDPLMAIDDPYDATNDFCASDTTYTTQAGDTCDSIALQFNVASASLFMGNVNLLNCFSIPEGTPLCIPFACDGVYTLQEGDTCTSIEKDLGMTYSHGATIRQYNPWINYDCSNLHEASDIVYGHVLCAVPQAGNFTAKPPYTNPTAPGTADGYAIPEIPPPDDVPVAEGTTYRCGKWHVVTNEGVQETCTTGCELVEGAAYCVGPTYERNTVFPDEEDEDEED
ncbi:hypothetical protein BDV19DRAFT_389702 [Aspergillus venezuelensis]